MQKAQTYRHGVTDLQAIEISLQAKSNKSSIDDLIGQNRENLKSVSQIKQILKDIEEFSITFSGDYEYVKQLLSKHNEAIHKYESIIKPKNK